MVAEPIRQEGFLVFQETSGAGMTFVKSHEEAEAKVKSLLGNNHPMLIVAATRYVTTRILELRGEPLD
jgi:hypothetical protein